METKATLKTDFNTLISQMRQHFSAPTDADFSQLIDATGIPALVVAASDASELSKLRADYVCDGVADDVEIHAALNALSNKGGIVLLTEGTFNLSTVLTIPNKPLSLIGQGTKAAVSATTMLTRLIVTLTATGDMLAIGENQTPQRFVGFDLVGDGVNCRNGIELNGSSFKQFINIRVTGMTTNGIRLLGSANQCYFENVAVYNSPANCTGWNLTGVSNTYIDCHAVRSGALGVGGYQGFKVGDSVSRFFGIVAERHWRGFEISEYAQNCTVVGLYTEGCETALFAYGTNPDEPKGNTIVGAYSLNATAPTDGAFTISNCIGLTLISPYVKSTTSGISITLRSVADTINIIGGQLNDTTKIENEGATRVYIRGVNGYVNEAKGAAASIADGGTIAHGLSGTPTIAQVQASEAGEMASVTGLDGTNITVAIKKHDGSAGTTQTIYWEAEI